MNLEDIHLVEISYSNLDEVEKPEMVYKYRSWNKGDVYSDNVLLKNQLYLAPPSSFVDKYDCKIPTRYDLLTEEETLKWGKPIVRAMHPRWNDKAIETELKYLVGRLPFKDIEKMKAFEEDEWTAYDAMAGILSLCTNPLNEEMWKMYGDGFSGICYGYNTEELIRGCGLRAAGPVIYVDELPIIHPLMDTIQKGTIRVFFKLREWEFEEEYRVREFSEANRDKANRIKIYSDDILKEVILGKDFDKEQIPIITNILKYKGSHATLFITELINGQLVRSAVDY